MADVWGFNDRETAERWKEIAAVPPTINRVNTERRKRPGTIGGDAILGITRTGGINARATTGVPHTFPSATIDQIDSTTGAAYSPAQEAVVFNASDDPVPEDTVVKAIKIGDRYFVIHGESEPILITFSLLANLSGTSGSTTTAEILDTTDPDNFPIGFGVVVVNTANEAALSGAEGTAIFLNDTWYVLTVNRLQPLFRIQMTCDSHGWTLDPAARGFNADQTTPITYGFNEGLAPYPTNFNLTLEINNPYNLQWLNGDYAIVCRYDASVYFVIKVIKAVCTRFRFRLTSDAPTGLTPALSVAALCPSNTEGGPPPSGTVTVQDKYYLAHNAKIGHKGVAEWDYNNAWWYVTQCEHWATRVLGTISTFSGTPGTFNVIPVTGLNGVTPTGTLSVQNRYSWEAGTSTHKIEIEWDPVNGQWNPVQMRCPT